MIERVKANKVKGGGNYFATPNTNLQFIPTGCKPLDLALGGGWAESRIANIVGDKSTGKTLLCIEACANFALKYRNKRGAKIRYREAESAFDQKYAEALGMPLDMVDFGEPLETVEDWFEDVDRVIKNATGPELYILDSLDALSDRAELLRDLDEGSYGTQKAKNISQLFRRQVRKLASANITMIVVSQVRSKIGVTYGRTTTRSGGRAMDFYASQVVYLTQMGVVNRTIKNIKRPVGLSLKAKVDKNKVSLAQREALFEIRFGYGIDDALACLAFLKEAGSLKAAGFADKDLKGQAHALLPEDMPEIHELVEKRWFEIETSFLPTRKKYGA